jgi:SOS-response transcriptional repressor LexA
MDGSVRTERHARRERILSVFLQQTVGRGTPYWWRPRGHSMSPTILDGDRVLIAPVDPRSLRLGDIVKFRFEDRLTMHRLVRRTQLADGTLRFVFHGDNAAEAEADVPASHVIGVAVAAERSGCVTTLCSRWNRIGGLLRIGLRTLSVRNSAFFK